MMRSFAKLSGAVAAAGLFLGLVAAAPASAEPTDANVAVAPVDCAALAGQIVPAGEIDLPTSGATVTSTRIVAASATMPEYCAVLGSIAPVDPTAPNINFGLNIPTAWNGSAWQLGGAGSNGRIPTLTASASGNQVYPSDPSPLALGYATFGSDSGHQGNGIEWIANHEALMNYAYEQLNKTHDTAVALIEKATGQTPALMYFSGNSQGGREAMMVAARWPELYDGVAASVGLAYFGNLIANVPYLGAKQLDPGTWIPPVKGPALSSYVRSLCDGADGVVDGVINDYLGCNAEVDPVTTPNAFSGLECSGGGDTGNTCLSAAQLQVLDYMYGPIDYDYPLAFGEQFYPGWGTALEGDGFVLSTREPVITDFAYGQGPGTATTKAKFCYPLGYQTCAPNDPPFSVLQFDIDAWAPVIQELTEQMDVPDTISGWLESGGKLVVTTHASDNISNPRAQMMLYNRWVEHHGRDAVNDSVRYFVVPNSGHGTSGGNNTDGVPVPVAIQSQSILIDWVEDGVTPPTETMAAAFSGGVAVASKPVCAFPAYPKYVSGSITDGSSYVCSDALTDLSAAIETSAVEKSAKQRLSADIAKIERTLDDTARACGNIAGLVKTLVKVTGRSDVSVEDATSMLTTIGAIKWGIGCLSATPTDAGIHQLFNVVGSLDSLDVATSADSRVRTAIVKAADGLAGGEASCGSLADIDEAIEGATGRGGKNALSESQAAELHAGVEAARSTLSCAG